MATSEQMPTADDGPVERVVRPAAWALAKDGRPYMLKYERDNRSDVYSWAPLYDQAALDAEVANALDSRAFIHAESSRIYARLAAAVRAGANDATLGKMLRAEVMNRA